MSNMGLIMLNAPTADSVGAFFISSDEPELEPFALPLNLDAAPLLLGPLHLNFENSPMRTGRVNSTKNLHDGLDECLLMPDRHSCEPDEEFRVIDAKRVCLGDKPPFEFPVNTNLLPVVFRLRVATFSDFDASKRESRTL